MANPEHLKILKQGVEVWNRWREENPGVAVPDFSRAALEKSDLGGANLEFAHLEQAELAGAVLEGANLKNAVLASANLEGADLSGASLESASLAGAILRSADLAGSTLRSCNLAGADFEGATMAYTSVINVDLSKVRGLNAVRHLRPSSIGIDTLYRSQGKISTTFLRGAGIAEKLIDYLPSLVTSTVIEFYSCFISYSHSDKSLARRLHDQLQARGIRCWLDEHDLKPGDRILDAVDKAIRLHDRILLCCSEASLESWWVKDEIRKAQERERTEEQRHHHPADGRPLPAGGLGGRVGSRSSLTPRRRLHRLAARQRQVRRAVLSGW